jgi:3-oxoacid CoA-transferase subunit A
MFNGRFFVCADLHGDTKNILHVLNWIENPSEEDTIIVCGDAGFEYEDRIMGSAKRAANSFPGKWVVLRGNHDSCYWKRHNQDPKWNFLLGESGDDFLYQKKYPNILYVRDCGGIYHIGKYNFLMLPGAFSVDKDYRISRRYPWNPDEQLSEIEMRDLTDLVKNWCEQDFPIDYVIGHTFPLYLQPKIQDLFIDFISQTKVDKRTEKWLDEISFIFENNSAFKQYYGGHFHSERILGPHYTMVYQTPMEIKE